VLEGLPINQYREAEITLGASTGDNKPVDKDGWPELPMPRDSHMLPEHSQQLLRAARSGRVYKPPVPLEDDNEMKEEEEEIKEVQSGFTIKKYVKLPRHLEATEPEYLAKRRKGLPSQYAITGVTQQALRETMVKKVDAQGNATVYKVLVPEGQAVEGEVQPTDAAGEVVPATAAPGTIVEGVGIVNAEGVVVANDILQQTPPRRRPPPPKKKKIRGGPGRGRKKVVFVEGAAEQGAAASNTGSDMLAVPGIRQEGGSVEPSDGDTPMADAGGEDDEASGEDGSDDEEHDAEHTSNPATPATPLRPLTAPTSVPAMDSTFIPATVPEEAPHTIIKNESPVPISEPGTNGRDAARDASSSPDLPLSAISHSRQNSLNQISSSAITEPEPMSLRRYSIAGSNPDVIPAPSTDRPSAPPSEPDLMGSLLGHLEKDNEDIAGS
jgi:hypothetical protein